MADAWLLDTNILLRMSKSDDSYHANENAAHGYPVEIQNPSRSLGRVGLSRRY